MSLHTLSTPRWGQKAKTFFFSESGHVAYQINGNITQSTVQSHILSLHTPTLDPWGGGQRSCCILKKGMEHSVSFKHLLCPYKHPQPLDGVKRPKHYFAESSHVAYQIKGNGPGSIMQSHILSLHTPSRERSIDRYRSKHFDLTHTPDLWVRLKGQILK